MKIAVITGASSGMGKEFARHFAAAEKWDEMWVIARRAERLEELKQTLSCPVRVLALDLTEPESWNEYAALLEKEKPVVDLLINASGFGKFGRYEQIPLQDCMDMIDLNCKALVAITQITLPYIPEGGRIVEVDSLSAFQPVPYMNVYASTKAFVLSYSHSLRAELRDRKIHVMALCPGWVKTEFFDHALKTSETAVNYYNYYFTAEEVVTRAMRDLAKRKAVCVPGWKVRWQVRFVKLMPVNFVMKTWLKQQKHW